MASSINPNDPLSSYKGDQNPNQPMRFDDDIQPDSELAEGRAGSRRIAMFAVAIVVLFGAVFYGFNNGSMNPSDGTKTATQSAPVNQDAQSKPPGPTNNIADSKPPVAPGVRDVTPTNGEPGTTTGASPARPQAPQAAPTGTEVDRSQSGGTN